MHRTRILLFLIMAWMLPASARLAAQGQPDRRFKRWDKNEDGKLSREELPEALQRNFARVDSDKNGFISLAEHTKFLARGGRRGNQQANRPRFNADLVTMHADLPYAGTENPRQRLDLLLPKKPAGTKPLPMLAFVHGGGWRNGDKSRGIGQVARFAESGRFAAASIGYRLSGEAKWPAQIHDCKAAIRWLKAHAKEYGFDPERICVFGTSAGGHLVAMLGVSGDVAKLEGELGAHGDQSSRVAAVIDFFGPTSFLTMNDFPSRIDHNAKNSPESLLIGGPVQERKEQSLAAAPVSYVSADDAPVLIMHGTKDPLVPFDQSTTFHAALTKAKVAAVLVPVTDGEHGFRGAAINERVDRFLEKYLFGKDVDISSEPIQKP